LHRFYTDSLYNPASLSDEDRAHYVRAYRAPGAMHAGFQWYRTLFEDAAFIQQAAAECLLPMPVLAIGGAHRMSHNVKASFKNVAAQVTGESWDQCGHYPHEEQPERLAARLQAFFAGAEAPDGIPSPTGSQARQTGE